MDFNVFQDPDNAEKQFDNYLNNSGLKNNSTFIKYWSIKDGESSILYFIKDSERGLAPLVFSQHRVWDSELKQGAGNYTVLSCIANGTSSNCPLCMVGEQPNLMNAWLIAEVFPTVTIVRLFSQNAKYTITKSIKEYLKAMDLSQVMIRVTKQGKGAFTIIPQQQPLPPYDSKQIIDLKKYFGMDKDRYARMQRIAEEIKTKNEQKARGENRQSELDIPPGGITNIDDVPF